MSTTRTSKININTLNLSLWTSSSGYHYVSDVSNLKHNSGTWYIIPRLLNISLEHFISILIDDYRAEVTYYPINNYLCYCWTENNLKYAKKFKKDISSKIDKILFIIQGE